MTRADGILLAVLALILATLYAALWPQGPGTRVQILSVAHNPLILALDQARTVAVRGRLGTSTVEIDHGQVRFVDSPCSGKICVHAGWQAHAGAFAACLPNGVSISVLGRERRFDAINF